MLARPAAKLFLSPFPHLSHSLNLEGNSDRNLALDEMLAILLSSFQAGEYLLESS